MKTTRTAAYLTTWSVERTRLFEGKTYAAVEAKTSALLAFVNRPTATANKVVKIASNANLVFADVTKFKLTIAPTNRAAARTTLMKETIQVTLASGKYNIFPQEGGSERFSSLHVSKSYHDEW